MPLNKSTVPHVLYNTPDPQASPSELYLIHGVVIEASTDPIKRWVMHEEHGYWDEGQKLFIHQQTTFLPNDPSLCVSLEDVYKEIQKQVMVRVRGGFRYQMEWYPYEPPFLRKFEIQPDGTRKQYL